MMAQMTNPSLARLTRTLAAVACAIGLILLVLLALNSISAAQAENTTQQAAPLQIDKLGPETTFAGQMISYTLRITNTSAMTLNGTIITDTWTLQNYDGSYQVGGGVSLSGTPRLITQPVKYIQFNLAPLAPGAAGWIHMSMYITPGLQPNYNGNPPMCNPICIVGNSAIITTATPGVPQGSDNVNTMIVGPVLRLTKTYTPTKPRAGRLLTFTFALENKNRSDAIDATHVVITEKLPNNMLFYAAYPPGLATYYPTTRTVRWALTQPVPVGSFAYVTLTVRIAPTAPYGQLSNPKANCSASADGLPRPVQCNQDVYLTVDDIFEKVTWTVSPPQQTGNISRTFPNRILTYTVYVYNPFTETVSGMIVTDTLPNYNLEPSRTFQYRGIVSHAPPGPPTVTLQNYKLVAWSLPPIEAWGVYTFAFNAFVPPQMRIDDNQLQKEYRNKLDGKYGQVVLPTNDGSHDDKMKVLVVPQIRTIKTVAPTKQIYALPVTYTLTLSNVGPTTISNIIITDVLPTNNDCQFRWGGMVSGQPPLRAEGNTAVWNAITLTGYTQWTVVFTATVYGKLNASCPNTVYGYSPDTYIVKWTNLAPVTVDVPFRYNKTVSPSSVVLGETIQYTVREYNIGGIDAVMIGFTDTLPTGFYYNGSPIYTDSVGVSYTLRAYHQNEYVTSFPVTVISAVVPNRTGPWCDRLPGSVPQKAGTFGIRISSPPQLARFWTNASDAAPVMVYPHAQATVVASPPGALPGGPITFTITLRNNTAYTITNVRITETLPTGFVYGGVLPGTPAPTLIVAPNIIWAGLEIPASGYRTLAFTATAPLTPGRYTNIVKAVSVSDPRICIPQNTLQNIPVSPGYVEVSKITIPANASVGPLGQFGYDVSLKNIGPYTITVLRFTDTLPGFPGDPWRFVSMQSGDPPPVSTDPPAWAGLTIAPNATRHLRFNVRVGTLLNSYKNLKMSSPPPTAAGQFTATMPAWWTITTPQSYNGAPVAVIPGVGLGKDVAPSRAYTGSTVIYTITLANQLATPINNVLITDTLPTGFTYNGIVSGPAPQSTNPLRWSLGTVNNQATQRLVFRVKIGNVVTGTYYNRVTASSSTALIPPTDDTAPVTVIGAPTLVSGKTVTPTQTIAGRQVTYTLYLTNVNDAPLTVRITDTLPNQFSFAAMVKGPAPIATAPKVVWDNFTVPANKTATLVFRAQIAPTAEGTYYNQFESASSWGVRLGSTGPTAPVVVLPLPTLDLSKSASPSTVMAGGEVTYTLQLVNYTTGAITARITDTLPNYFSFARMVNDPMPVQVSPRVVWNNITVPAGTAVSLAFCAQVGSAAPAGTYYNQLDGVSTLGKVFTGTGQTAPVLVTRPPDKIDLQISKSDRSPTATIGGLVVYTLRYTNSILSGRMATNVTLTETLAPAGYLIAQAPGWTLVTPGVYTRSVEKLAIGESRSVTFGVQISPTIPVDYMAITNTAQIGTSMSGVVDPSPSNNTSTDIDIIRGADIVATNLVAYTPPRLQADARITVVVTLQNQGIERTYGAYSTYPYGFGTDLYVKPVGAPPPTGPGDRYLGACPTQTNYCPYTIRPQLYQFIPDGLQAGQVAVLTFTYPLPAGGNYWLYVQADTFWGQNGDPDWTLYGSSAHGRIVEGNERNNILGPVAIQESRLKLYLPLVLRNG